MCVLGIELGFYEEQEVLLNTNSSLQNLCI